MTRSLRARLVIATAMSLALELATSGCTAGRIVGTSTEDAPATRSGFDMPPEEHTEREAGAGLVDDAPDTGVHEPDAVGPVHDGGSSSQLDGGGGSEDAGPTSRPDIGHPRHFVLADEPLHKVLYVDLDDPSNDWDLTLDGGARDLQLIGDGRVLVGTVGAPGGYYEIEIATGKIVGSALGFGRVMAVRRLASGKTLVMGEGLSGGQGTVVLEVDAAKNVARRWEFPSLTGGRLIRRTREGNFLIGTKQPDSPGKDALVEITPEGRELRRFAVNAQPAYMGLRLPSGETVVANGHGAELLVFDLEGKLVKTLGGYHAPETEQIRAHHFSQFQILPNGHYIVSNWQGHETTHGADGRQLIEYDAQGNLVWSWDQDPTRISSIHGVLVLDGLDLELLHDDVNGVTEPVR